MASIAGADYITRTVALAAPVIGGQLLVAVPVPARFAVVGCDVAASDLDTAAVPAITLNVGDAALPTRFIAGSVLAQTGGEELYRPEPEDWHRYVSATDVELRVATGPAAGAPSGAATLTVYGYLSIDQAALIRMVLLELGVLSEAQTPRASDAEDVRLALAEVHETLRGKGIANRRDVAWPLTLVPVFAARPYARLAAQHLAATFGVSAQRFTRIAALGVEAERELRRQVQVRSTGAPVSLEPYHDDVIPEEQLS